MFSTKNFIQFKWFTSCYTAIRKFNFCRIFSISNICQLECYSLDVITIIVNLRNLILYWSINHFKILVNSISCHLKCVIFSIIISKDVFRIVFMPCVTLAFFKSRNIMWLISRSPRFYSVSIFICNSNLCT